MSDDSFLSRWARRKADVKAGRSAPSEPVATPVALESIPAASPAAAEVPAAARASTPLDPGAAGTIAEAPNTEPPAPPAPTLEDVAALAPGDEISRFVARGVDESVKRAAVKKLFTDPRYNIMDGLDTYIDDYSQPDPIPMAMLRKMNQSKFLGLFAEEEAAEALAAAQAQATGSATAAPESTAGPAADPAFPPAPAQDAGPVASAVAAVPHAPHENSDLQLQPDDAARRPGTELGAGRERG